MVDRYVDMLADQWMDEWGWTEKEKIAHGRDFPFLFRGRISFFHYVEVFARSTIQV